MITRLLNFLLARPRAPPSGDGVPPEQQTPVSPVIFWTSMILVVAVSVILIWFALGNVNTAKFGNGPQASWPKVLLLLVFAVFVVATLATSEIIPWRSSSWADWRQPKVLGMVIFLLLSAVGFFAGLSNVFNPPSAEQETMLATQKTVNTNNADTKMIKRKQNDLAEAFGIGRQSLVRRKIPGLWGRPGCDVTYRFSLAAQALTVRSIKNPPGVQPYDPEYTVIADRDAIASGGERSSVIEATEAKGFWPGFAVQFRYMTNGSTETLVWDHKKMQTMPLELVRC